MTIDVYKVVKKLIGEIDPIGETQTDDERFENLKAMTDCFFLTFFFGF